MLCPDLLPFPPGSGIEEDRGFDTIQAETREEMIISRKPGKTISRNELEASICKDSFYDFLCRFWYSIIPEKFTNNWHIEYLCDELQQVAERVFRGEPKEYDLVINISPGSTKSTICSIMFPAWCWTRMSTFRTICGSYAYHLAMDLSRKCRDVVQSDKWKELFGNINLREDQNTKGYFVNTEGGSRVAVGTGGSITGMHGHILVIDDPLDPNQAVSEAELAAANRWMSETLPTRKVDKTITPTILIMQRLHQDDPSGRMLEMADRVKIRHICLPAEIDESNRGEVKPRKLVKSYVDGLMDPVRLPKSVLTEAKAELGEYGFAGQFMQRPVPLGGGMFKTGRIEIVNAVPNMKMKIRYWDKAGTVDGGAYTVGLLMGRDEDGNYWILDVVRGQWESAAREKIILQTARIDGKDVLVGIEQEPGSGGKESAENTTRMLAGFRVRIDRPVGDKVLRADPYSVQVNGGNVRLKQGLWNRAYLEELQFFPHSKYKDQVDSSSGAFSILTRKRIRVGAL